MGTINYFTSDYVTLGLKPYDYDDFANDQDFREYAKEQLGPDYDDDDFDKLVYDTMFFYSLDDYDNVERILDTYDFYYFHVVIKNGYYYGFTIDIENNFGVAFDDYLDRREAQKEVTQLKKFLLDCANVGLVACYPYWCTDYADYETTVAEIKEAIKAIREEVKATPTWTQYTRSCA